MSKILIIAENEGSLNVVSQATKILDESNVDYDVHVASALCTPNKLDQLIEDAEESGCEVIVALSDLAAHLPGVVASKTLIPVIGVPIYIPLNKSTLGSGLDSIGSILQMPYGIPVGCMGVGLTGMGNALLYAVRILALKDRGLKEKLVFVKAEIEKYYEEIDYKCGSLGESTRKIYTGCKNNES